MIKIKNKINRFFKKNLHHLQEGLFAITMVFVLGGFVFSNIGEGGEQLKAFLNEIKTPSVELLEASSLNLSGESAPENIVKFEEKYIGDNWNNNDALLTNVFKKSLVFQIIKIAKYILAGTFMIFLGLYVVTFLSASDKEEHSKKFNDQVLWALVGFIILALAQPLSEAFVLLKSGAGGKVDLITNPQSALASAQIVGFTYRAAAHIIQYILGGLALIMIGASAFRIIQAVGDEETIKSARKSIVWAAIGLIIAGGSTLFIDQVFAPKTALLDENTGVISADLNTVLTTGQDQARALILNYVKYFQTFIGAGAIFMLFLAGFKMVSAAGNEEVVTKQRKMITWVFMGLAVILVSEGFVNVFMPNAVEFNSKTAILNFSAQMGGFTNFLLTFASGIAVLALIVGAVYISSAVANPEQAEKGKKIILSAILGLIITFSAFALVNTVLSGDAAGGASQPLINVSIQK